MTSYLRKNDTVMLLPVANITQSPFHTHSLHSTVTIWSDNNNALTVSSKLKVVHHPGSKHIHKNNAHIITAITENYMTLSFIRVYFSSKPSNGYKIFEKQQGENKKDIK